MGYYDMPNLLNVPGEDLPHVSHFYREAHPYYRQRVVIVGGKNSACEAALELFRTGAHVTMVHRGPGFGESVKYWVKPDIENRVKEGSIAAHFNARLVEIRANEVVLDTGVTLPRRACCCLTGYRGPTLSSCGGLASKFTKRRSRRSTTSDLRDQKRAGIICRRRPGAGKRTGTVVHRRTAASTASLIARTLSARLSA